MIMEWWHWVVIGLALVGIELFAPVFFFVWFGLGALLVALASWVVRLPLAGQLALWAATSILMLVLWLKFFRNPDRTRAGQAKDGALGAVGLVTVGVTETGRGEILFQRPVLGADRWPVVADQSIEAGDKARVVDILGQMLKVEKL